MKDLLRIPVLVAALGYLFTSEQKEKPTSTRRSTAKTTRAPDKSPDSDENGTER